MSFCLYWVMNNEGGGRGETMDPRDIYLSEEAPTFENLASGLYYRLQTLRQENNRQERLGGNTGSSGRRSLQVRKKNE